MKKVLLIIPLFISLVAITACKKDNNGVNPAPATLVDCSTTANTATQSRNASIESFRLAMVDFRNSLSSDLLNTAAACLDGPRLTQWSNLPAAFNQRDGINYGQLSAAQLTSFKNLMQLFLSADGYQKVNEISVLAEGFLNAINSTDWNPDRYFITLFGDPTTSGSWGFQLDGHHCAINFLVHGDNVSIVPAFLGGEPTVGTFNNTPFDIFKDERDLALALYNGFTTAENSAAVSNGNAGTMLVGPPENGGDAFAGAYDYTQFANGLKYSDMSATTQANVVLLMKEYVYNLNTIFADIWWADIMANIDDTYFVWLDNVDTPTAQTQFYYRIYNPYLWVEYNMDSPAANGVENWNHAHTITRIPNNPATNNGGDYGLFAQIINQAGTKTLYEHYMSADHHKESELLFDYKVEIPHVHKHEHGHEHGHSHSHGSNHHHS